MPIIESMLVGAVVVAGGFILYKIIPGVYNKASAYIKKKNYKQYVYSLGQNRMKTLNMLRYMAKHYETFDNTSNVVGISIKEAENEDPVEYKIPIDEYTVIYNGDVFKFRVNMDTSGAVTGVIVSTYKRKFIFATDNDKLNRFESFINKFSTTETMNFNIKKPKEVIRKGKYEKIN